MITSMEVFKLYYALAYKFKASNNEANYEGVIRGLHLAASSKVKRLWIKIDSRLVVEHLTSSFEVKGENMILFTRMLLRDSLLKLTRMRYTMC